VVSIEEIQRFTRGGIKVAGHEAFHLLHIVPIFKKNGCYIYTAQYASIGCYSVTDKENFTFTSISKPQSVCYKRSQFEVIVTENVKHL
jgi:hypothetical protein